MYFSVQDFLREAEAQTQRDREQTGRFDDLARDNHNKIADLQASLRSALRELGAALLPSVDRISADTLADTLGMPEVSRLWQQNEQRGNQIEKELSQIVQSESWKTREIRQGRAERALEETTPLWQHARREWEHVSGLPRMNDLMARGWGTPRYPHRSVLRFFNREFLGDWRAADEAVATLKVPDFVQAAATYNERQEQVQVLGRTVEEQQGILQGIVELEQERQRLQAEHDDLPAHLQEQVALRASELLSQTPALADRLPDAATIRARALAIDGKRAQTRYLEDVQVQIERDRADIAERAERLRQERERYGDTYRYRNKQFTQEQFDKRFGRSSRWDNRYNRYNRVSTTVYSFNSYDRVSYYDSASDFLWWDVMTDGRIDGNFIPEIAEYRSANPDYQFDRGYASGNFDTGSSGSYNTGDFDLS